MSWSANESGSCSSASISWRSPLKTRARPRKTPSWSPPSTPASFSTAPPSGARFPCSSRSPPVSLNGAGDGMDHVPVGRRRIEPADLLGERLAGAGERLAVEQAGLEQLLDDHLQATLGVDVDHRVEAERAHVDEYRQPTRERVELALAEHVGPEVEPGGTRDLDAVQHHVGRPAHRDRHRQRVAQRRRRDDVAGA